MTSVSCRCFPSRLSRVRPRPWLRTFLEGAEHPADALSPPADPSVEQSIRDIAYRLWENDGRPEGRDDEYWHRARTAWQGQQSLDAGFEEAVTGEDPAPGTRTDG